MLVLFPELLKYALIKRFSPIDFLNNLIFLSGTFSRINASFKIISLLITVRLPLLK